MTEQEWLASTDPGVMLAWLTGPEYEEGWSRSRQWPVSDRKLRLFACAVALHAWGGARGQVLRNVEAAYAAVERGRGHPLFDESPLALVASELTPACLSRPEDAALFAALLREVVGNPFRPPSLAPPEEWMGYPPGLHFRVPRHWLTPAVLGIARRAYDLRDWEALPILADALQDAGCEDEEVLMHCRGKGRCPDCLGKGGCCSLKDEPGVWGEMHRCALCAGSGWVDSGPHVRGCWCLDVILGRE